MSHPAPASTVAALNEKIAATKPLRICTMCHEEVGAFWAGRICRECFIESEGFTNFDAYDAAERGER